MILHRNGKQGLELAIMLAFHWFWCCSSVHHRDIENE